MTKRQLMILAALTASSPAFASERSNSTYPHGAENWATAAVPPPGTYLLDYANFTTYDRLNGDDGQSLVPDFKVDAFANVMRVVHVTDRRILGATYAVQAIVPVVDLSVRAGGGRSHVTGIGDIVVNPMVLSWKAGDVHITAGIDIFLPTGGFKASRLANIGRNYVTFEPVLAVSYLPKSGFDLSAKIMYDLNTRNPDTKYLSGQELHVDFALGKTFKNGLGVGAAGYVVHQTTDDSIRDAPALASGNRGRVFAIGPTVKYPVGKALLMAIWQHEVSASNRPQGDKFWLRLITRL